MARIDPKAVEASGSEPIAAGFRLGASPSAEYEASDGHGLYGCRSCEEIRRCTGRRCRSGGAKSWIRPKDGRCEPWLMATIIGTTRGTGYFVEKP